MNSAVEKFIKTSKIWKQEITLLRWVLLKTKLEETFKWHLPCYSYQGKNVVIIQPFKNSLALMFFKGSLLKDSKRILVSNGPNTQAARRFEFRSEKEIAKATSLIKAYIQEAIDIEKSGRKVELKKRPQSIPKELKAVFAKRPKLKMAFESLTPGRQRAYLLHFCGAKQSSTRQSRIEKCIPNILAGKGMNGR